MPLVTFYFQLHQPHRLHPDGPAFLWDLENEKVFQKVADKCYVPATALFVDLIRAHPSFKVCLSMSGTFLEQAQRYRPQVIALLRELFQAGEARGQVEFLEETFYHSLTGLFADPDKAEFREQVVLHRQAMETLFGARPTAFRNTELMYNNEIANVVADMGYQAMLCEQRDDLFAPNGGNPVSRNAVFRAKARNGRARRMVVLARNRNLSDDVAFRLPHAPLTATQYARFLAQIDGEAVILGYDYEHIGEHIWKDKGIFDFWRELPVALGQERSVVVANPTEIAERFRDAQCPLADIHPLSTSSWADAARNTQGWLGSMTQYKLFQAIESLEGEVKQAGGEWLSRYRTLTTSDHLYYLHEGRGPDGSVHEYFSPYGSPVAAAQTLTRALGELRYGVKCFNVHKRTEQTAVILITPETGRMPSEGTGYFDSYRSGRSGDLGEVLSALCRGLSQRRIPVHVVTLDLPRRFRGEAGGTGSEPIQRGHSTEPAGVHLVASARYRGCASAYDGDAAANAAEFQSQIVNTALKEIHGLCEGRAVLHSNDWMAGGIVTAYAALRGIPVLHTVHNTQTADIPVPLFRGVNMDRLKDRLILCARCAHACVDAQATAVKNATQVSFVGRTFLQEIVHNPVVDPVVVAEGVRLEIRAKWARNGVTVIPNGIPAEAYPENQPEDVRPSHPGLAMRFGPDDDLVEAKRANLAKFQRRTGLRQNPNGILLYWPSCLDPAHQGIELLEAIAQRFVDEHADVQIAVVGDPVGPDRSHAEVMGRLASASGGRIAVHRFDPDLSMLGYAAAADVFGASLVEPSGRIDVMGNLYGATATNRATGGHKDKISPLSLVAWGGPMDRGNGVLFTHYDPQDLWRALDATVRYHRYFRMHPDQWQRQMQRIMVEARKAWSVENMVAGYIMAYEQLNGGRPLV
ncbi:MAG: glycogen/starch synthase [Phycisphaerae bacterium]|nr:glycogen/starch synthase [Phycisphaerae bacterium]